MSKSFQPNWISPPGNTILDILGERQIPMDTFAQMMNFSLSEADRLIKGVETITHDIAGQLAQCLGASPQFWVNRDVLYRESVVNLDKQEQDKWVASLPIKDMIKFGCISSQQDRLTECLHFFNSPDIKSWEQKYSKEISSVRFRTSITFENQPGAVAVWIRMGEIQAESIACEAWNLEGFRNSLVRIRQLIKLKDPETFIPRLQEICAENGVAVAVVPTPNGCSASGATKFLTPDKAMLLLSFRYLSDDQFWFTFFHEAGHLLLHGKEAVFIEEKTKEKTNDVWDERENEANSFSADFLIPNEYRYELSRIPLTKRGIVSFAVKLGISPGIVIGQMQFSGRLKYNQLNSYKRKYKWPE